MLEAIKIRRSIRTYINKDVEEEKIEEILRAAMQAPSSKGACPWEFIVVDDNETLILNNIKFTNVEDLQIKINANTKAKDVVTLKIKDSYTEGEFMTRMRNNGYSCK